MDRELPETVFSRRLIRLNGLHGFREWVFHPGMLFGSLLRWWGEGGYRDGPHEGLDLCLYRDGGGRLHGLDKGTEIPLIYEGEVVGVVGDFLGKSVFVRHGLRDRDGCVLYTVYGHVEPLPGVAPGGLFGEGEAIAALADTGGKSIRPHLHLSMAWISPDLRPEGLGWEAMREAERARLLDPLPVVAESYTVIEGGTAIP